MPFNNSIAGGNGTLVRNQLQSENFVAGVSGWRISKNGNSEFNNGIFRGSLAIGTAPAQHAIINPGNGDILDVYDASGNLVAQIIGSGTYINYLFSGATAVQHMRYQSTGMVGLSDGDSSLMAYQFDPTGTALPNRPQLTITVANNAANHVYQLKMQAGSDAGPELPTMTGTEQGITGTVTQSSVVGSNNLIFAGDFTGVTDAAGKVVVTHGAGFTPSKVFVQVHDTGTPTFGDVDVMNGSVNATTFQVFCTSFTGVTRASATVSFYYFCIK